MAQPEADSFKIVVVGPSGVGKTAIVTQLVSHTFKDQTPLTIGVEFKSFTVQADDQSVKLQIWDTAGQERFRSVSKAYFRGAVGAVLVFDVTQKASFDELNNWIQDLNTLCAPNALIILVGNKTDLTDERTVSETEAQEVARRYNLEYIETSAKNGDNIAETFVRLGVGILTKVKKGEMTIVKRDETFIDPVRPAQEPKTGRGGCC
jgi:small GTP-binding protein